MKEYLALVPEDTDDSYVLLSSEGEILVRYDGNCYRVTVSDSGEFEFPPEFDVNHPIFQSFLLWAFEKGLLAFSSKSPVPHELGVEGG